MVNQTAIPIKADAVREFCLKWGVKELSLFGSILRPDFRPDSDVDVMLEFLPERGFTFENTPLIIEDLSLLFGRGVDVVEKGRIRNRFRRESILSNRRVMYAA